MAEKAVTDDERVVNRWIFMEADDIYSLDVAVNWLHEHGILSGLHYQTNPNGGHSCALQWVGPARSLRNFNYNVRPKKPMVRNEYDYNVDNG